MFCHIAAKRAANEGKQDGFHHCRSRPVTTGARFYYHKSVKLYNTLREKEMEASEAQSKSTENARKLRKRGNYNQGFFNQR